MHSVIEKHVDPRPLRKQLESRTSMLENAYQSFKAYQHEVSTWFQPRTGRFLETDPNRSDGRNEGIIDNTGTLAADILAAGLSNGASNENLPWMRLQTNDPLLNKRKDVREWLDFVTEEMLRMFSGSNLYQVLPQVYLEMALYGTAATIVMPHPERVIHLHPLTAGQYMLATNDEDEVNTLYREFQMTVAQLVRRFGLENCSNEVMTAWHRGELDSYRDVMHAIEPREDRDTTKDDNENMPWRSVYWEIGTSGDKILRESGFKHFPALTPRWAVNPGDVYGNGPGMKALEDTISLQHAQFRLGQAIDFMTKPPITLPSDMKNTELDTSVGGVNFTDATGPNQNVRSMWQVQLEVQPMMVNIEKIQGRINMAFHVPLFLMLQNADKNGLTAEEVRARLAEKASVIGPALGKIENEVLKRVVDIGFDNMVEAGRIPMPPDELKGQPLRVQFVSLLAQAQRAASGQSIDNFIGSVGAVSQYVPSVLHKINWNEWVDDKADKQGVPAKIIRSSEDANELAGAQAKAQAAQAQIDAQAVQAGAAKDAASAVATLPDDIRGMARQTART